MLFERGAFGPAEAQATAWALAAYAIGIPAHVIVKALNAAFFARQDTATPVRVAVVVTAANLALGVALMPVLEHVGIALATGLTAWANLALLAGALRRRGFLHLDERFLGRAPRLHPASRVELGTRLTQEVQRYVRPLPAPGTHPEAFLAAVLAERRDRELVAEHRASLRRDQEAALLHRLPHEVPDPPR